jgi:predicted methyltransferase
VSNLTEFWLSSPVEVIVFGGGLALLIYLLFFSQPTSVPLASNETGKLLISRKALHRLVEACCGQVKGVASASASIKFKQDRLNTERRRKVRPEAKLDAIQGYLTQEITEIYRQNLGLSGDIGPIEIIVVGVIAAEPSF